MTSVILLAFAIVAIAVLYSAVGHAGAAGSLAAMAIASERTQDEMKAVAFTLNIFVGAIGSDRFVRAGQFHCSNFWPLGISAVPMAFLGGLWELPPLVFRPLIAGVLFFAALVMLARALRPREQFAEQRVAHMPPLSIALIAGAALGLMAGLTGTGGGIFLSPFPIVAGWADPKRTAGVSVVFVLVNSIAGLASLLHASM